jgi:hypothetical protein
VQAHWLDGADERRYSPIYVDSALEARETAREMSETLRHFTNLRVDIDEVDRTSADADEAAIEARRASASKPLLHVFAADRTRALCGAKSDELNALVALDLLELSDGEKCTTCINLSR